MFSLLLAFSGIKLNMFLLVSNLCPGIEFVPFFINFESFSFLPLVLILQFRCNHSLRFGQKLPQFQMTTNSSLHFQRRE